MAVLVERDGAVRVLEPGPAWQSEGPPKEVIENHGQVFEYESTERTWDGKWAHYYREKG